MAHEGLRIGRERRVLAEQDQHVARIPEQHPHRQHEQDRGPHRLADGPPHVAHAVRAAAALARDHRRRRRHHPHPEYEAEHVQVHAQRRRGERVRANAAEQDHVGRMNQGLRQIGQHHRRGQQRGRLGFAAPRVRGRGAPQHARGSMR
jgi:hypothetical protein